MFSTSGLGPKISRFLVSIGLGLFSLCGTQVLASTPFVAPDPAELAMTGIPGYPNVPAVVLYREEMQEDWLGRVRHYERVKILSDAGKKYATVQLNYVQDDDDKKIYDIAARTIHADGKIVPFTGKPFTKVILNAKGFRLKQIAFVLPEPEVGSVLEYSYAVHHDGEYLERPEWILQDDLYIKAEQYLWQVTSRTFFGPSGISMRPNLPPGATIERKYTGMPGVLINAKSWNDHSVGVFAKDVPPLPELDFLPPIDSLRYKVIFGYFYTNDPKEFWSVNGKSWSKDIDEFLVPSDRLRQSATETTAGSANADEKLHKIYAFIMSLENTDDTRAKSQREIQAEGHKEIKTVSDLLDLKHGNSFAMTCLFVALARAAGFQAYMMHVPDRSIELFDSTFLSFAQLDDYIAIVNVDGKERFFDPGTRYCAYGELAWQHTLVYGLRQTATGSEIATTPGGDAHANVTFRNATLKLSESGDVTGKIQINLRGSAALAYREIALRADEAEMRQQMKTTLEAELPSSLQVEISEVQNLRDYEKPLVFGASVEGTLGAPAGKRRIVPADIFTSRDASLFVAKDRPIPVFFHYAQIVQDSIRLIPPASMEVESTPEAKDIRRTNLAYTFAANKTPAGLIVNRVVGEGGVLIPVSQYPDLRDFFRQYQSADAESVVLKPLPAEKAAATTHGAAAN